MCSGVIIHRPGQEDCRCDTQGELAQAIGLENIDFDGDCFEPTICLCPIDIESTAKKAGFVLSRTDSNGEYDPWDDHFYPVEERSEV